MKKVFVSGCYDLLHSGHIAFFKEAARYGDLYVGIGADSTVFDLKGRKPVNSEAERLYMVKSIKYIKDAFINRGSGYLDFKEELKELKPDLFIVNEDGNSQAKLELCKKLNIEYVALRRIPEPGLKPRSTTEIRRSDNCLLPYRLDIAGTWIDQPYVSKLHPGWAITVSLEPIVEYNERSGMATSTRNIARKYWPYQLPLGNPEKIADMMFHFENGPGKEIISGAQDSIGICMPGLVKHYYDKKYWPVKIESCHDDTILTWLENHIQMIPLWPRDADLDLLTDINLNVENVKKLTFAAEKCWDSIIEQNLILFAKYFQASFDAQVALFPRMINEKIQKVIDQYKDKILACKLAGAGGGGYLILVVNTLLEDAMNIKIRRRSL